MVTRIQTEEVFRALAALPAEKVVEVQDFILFLKTRHSYAKAIDESDTWTDEDLHDLTTAVLNHANFML